MKKILTINAVLLALLIALSVLMTIVERTNISLSQKMLDHEFKLGVYAAVVTLKEERMLSTGKINIPELVQMSFIRQDSLRTKIDEVTK